MQNELHQVTGADVHDNNTLVDANGHSKLCGSAGVSKQSVDTWMHPNLFRMEYSTGAPPDYFDRNGQNWGFPTYNWEEMSKDGYAWWRQRLSNLSQCVAPPQVQDQAQALAKTASEDEES